MTTQSNKSRLRAKINQEIMAETRIENGCGESFSIADLVAQGAENKARQRAKLMHKMACLERQLLVQAVPVLKTESVKGADQEHAKLPPALAILHLLDECDEVLLGLIHSLTGKMIADKALGNTLASELYSLTELSLIGRHGKSPRKSGSVAE